ncbi:Yap-binding/alf4/glomulin [Globisporangium polare]
MARDELPQALQLLRTASSAADVRARFVEIHAALGDIQRKRSRFLEDALAAVLRHAWRFVKTSEEDGGGEPLGGDDAGERLPALQATELCLEFAEPLLPSAAKQHARFEDAASDGHELARERAVFAAYLLFLLGKDASILLSSDDAALTLRRRLVEHILGCGVDLESILSTSRFREELRECQRMLLPSSNWTSDDEDDFSSDDEEDRGEGEESKIITQTALATWNLSEFEYFVTESGQEYAFASWSAEGIRAFAYVLLVELEKSEAVSHPLSVVTSALSWLFIIAPSIQALLQDEEHPQLRLHGIQLLSRVLQFVPNASVHFHSADDTSDEPLPSFRDQCSAYLKRDWLTSLVQLVTNVMVSSPEQSDRSLALASLRSLFGKVVLNDRFFLLRSLVIKCPYANASAVLIDTVRSNTVLSWASLDEHSASPFTNQEIGELLRDVLLHASERDLVMQADLVASCSSVLRFLYIRDKTNRTGVRCDGPDSIKVVLQRIEGRVRARIQELSPQAHSHDDHHHSHGSHAHYHPSEEFNRLLILQAVLDSTLSD